MAYTITRKEEKANYNTQYRVNYRPTARCCNKNIY